MQQAFEMERAEGERHVAGDGATAVQPGILVSRGVQTGVPAAVRGTQTVPWRA
ncbi:hypothetical protein [Streptomyces sp. RB17]|uniref:hypothetical protein n=1 Tax=Streptomyces sp. RB17 TaxID=2585197 RepID=UPI0012964844|nr:hypothetical protein [Streptomyces sp. RB17]